MNRILAELRKAAGLTQQEAANALRVDIRTYRRWELGETSLDNLSRRRKEDIVNLFGKQAESLIQKGAENGQRTKRTISTNPRKS